MSSRTLGIGAAMVLAASAVLDTVSPRTLPQVGAPTRSVSSGVLGCPWARGSDGSGSVYVANLGDAPADVRVTTVPLRGSPAISALRLAAGSVASVRVGGRRPIPSGAIVEYAGSEIVASHSVITPAGVATATCASPGGDVAVPGLRTRDAESTLTILNPGAARAEVSVTLLSDGRRLAPIRLSGFEVPPRGRRRFLLGDFAFAARDLVALVHAVSGRVVAEGLIAPVSGRGLDLIGSVVPSTAGVAISGASGPGAVFSAAAVGEDDSGIDARLITPGGARAFPGMATSVGGGETKSARIVGPPGPSAIALDVSVGSPVAVATKWGLTAGRGYDEAGLEGVGLAQRWGGVAATAVARSTLYIVVANPGADPATLHIRLLNGSTADVVLGGGRSTRRVLTRTAGIFGFEVSSDVGVAVAVVGASVGAVVPTVRVFGLAATPLELFPTIDVAVEDRPAFPAPGLP